MCFFFFWHGYLVKVENLLKDSANFYRSGLTFLEVFFHSAVNPPPTKKLKINEFFNKLARLSHLFAVYSCAVLLFVQERFVLIVLCTICTQCVTVIMFTSC